MRLKLMIFQFIMERRGSKISKILCAGSSQSFAERLQRGRGLGREKSVNSKIINFNYAGTSRSGNN